MKVPTKDQNGSFLDTLAAETTIFILVGAAGMTAIAFLFEGADMQRYPLFTMRITWFAIFVAFGFIGLAFARLDADPNP